MYNGKVLHELSDSNVLLRNTAVPFMPGRSRGSCTKSRSACLVPCDSAMFFFAAQGSGGQPIALPDLLT